MCNFILTGCVFFSYFDTSITCMVGYLICVRLGRRQVEVRNTGGGTMVLEAMQFRTHCLVKTLFVKHKDKRA